MSAIFCYFPGWQQETLRKEYHKSKQFGYYGQVTVMGVRYLRQKISEILTSTPRQKTHICTDKKMYKGIPVYTKKAQRRSIGTEPLILHLGARPPVPTAQEAGWAPQPVWNLFQNRQMSNTDCYGQHEFFKLEYHIPINCKYNSSLLLFVSVFSCYYKVSINVCLQNSLFPLTYLSCNTKQITAPSYNCSDSCGTCEHATPAIKSF